MLKGNPQLFPLRVGFAKKLMSYSLSSLIQSTKDGVSLRFEFQVWHKNYGIFTTLTIDLNFLIRNGKILIFKVVLHIENYFFKSNIKFGKQLLTLPFFIKITLFLIARS